MAEGMASIPPFEGCIRCGRGDTLTAFAVEGPGGFHVATLTRISGWSRADAIQRLSEHLTEMGYGDVAELPDEVELFYRLCSDCGEKVGQEVGRIAPNAPSSPLPGIRPDGA